MKYLIIGLLISNIANAVSLNLDGQKERVFFVDSVFTIDLDEAIESITDKSNLEHSSHKYYEGSLCAPLEDRVIDVANNSNGIRNNEGYQYILMRNYVRGDNYKNYAVEVNISLKVTSERKICFKMWHSSKGHTNSDLENEIRNLLTKMSNQGKLQVTIPFLVRE